MPRHATPRRAAPQGIELTTFSGRTTPRINTPRGGGSLAAFKDYVQTAVYDVLDTMRTQPPPQARRAPQQSRAADSDAGDDDGGDGESADSLQHRFLHGPQSTFLVADCVLKCVAESAVPSGASTDPESLPVAATRSTPSERATFELLRSDSAQHRPGSISNSAALSTVRTLRFACVHCRAVRATYRCVMPTYTYPPFLASHRAPTNAYNIHST